MRDGWIGLAWLSALVSSGSPPCRMGGLGWPGYNSALVSSGSPLCGMGGLGWPG